MPAPRALPRKYLSLLEETQEQLRLMAQRARLALTELERNCPPYRQTPIVLRDIETDAYKAALALSEIQVAGTCDECPAAPSVTSTQIYLYTLADELEQHAQVVRSRAGLKRSAVWQAIGVEPSNEAGPHSNGVNVR